MQAVEHEPTANQAADDTDGDSQIEVIGVSPEVAPAVWPMIADMIEAARSAVPAAVAAREHLEDILEKIQSRAYQLWLIYDDAELAAVAVTSVDRYTRLTCLTVQYMGGRALDAWLGPWTEQIKGWAQENGCTQIEARGRLGWGKKLAPIGAEIAGAAYVLEIAQ